MFAIDPCGRCRAARSASAYGHCGLFLLDMYERRRSSIPPGLRVSLTWIMVERLLKIKIRPAQKVTNTKRLGCKDAMGEQEEDATMTAPIFHSDKRIATHRPPGVRSEADLLDRCTSWGDCVAVCPAQALALDENGLPVLQRVDTCDWCGLCADVCSYRALALTPLMKVGL